MNNKIVSLDDSKIKGIQTFRQGLYNKSRQFLIEAIKTNPKDSEIYDYLVSVWIATYRGTSISNIMGIKSKRMETADRDLLLCLINNAKNVDNLQTKTKNQIAFLEFLYILNEPLFSPPLKEIDNPLELKRLLDISLVKPSQEK